VSEIINLLVTHKRFGDIETDRYDSPFGQNAHYRIGVTKWNALDWGQERKISSV